MISLLQPYAAFWRCYRANILALLGIAALSVGGLYLRGLPFDLAAFRTVNTGGPGPALDVLGTLGYVLGSFWFSAALFVALLLLGYRRLGAGALGAIIAGGLLTVTLKYLTREPRPVQGIPEVRLVGLYALGPAYPSGHAVQAFLTAFLLSSYFAPPWYGRAGLYILAALIGLSRVYVGEHLPVDVIIGGAIGVLVGVMWVHSRLWPGPRSREGSSP